jgi:hypothetical protein
MDRRRHPTKARVVSTVIAAVLVLACGGTALAHHGYDVYALSVQLSPGEGRGSVYDYTLGCSWWREQRMQKSKARLGTIAWIDLNGGWVHSVKTAEMDMWYIAGWEYTKKLHCRNSSSETYWATCRGHTVPKGQCA